MSICIEQIYFALTTNSPAVIICPLVDVSVVFMAPYLPDSTNDSLLSLIPSRTTWCISSNVSYEVYFGCNWIMFQLLKDPNNSQ